MCLVLSIAGTGLERVPCRVIGEAFQQMDFDGNGFVGVSELRYLLTVIGEDRPGCGCLEPGTAGEPKKVSAGTHG